MAVTKNITTIPASRVPLTDERTKLMSREWYRFFNNQYIKTTQSANAVTPENYGAVGDGATDDSASIQAALDSKFDVYLTPGRIYAVGTTLTMSTPNQSFGGPGVLRIVGAINGLELISPTATIVTGIQLDLTFDSPTQTAGWAVYIENSSRVKINKLNIIRGFGGLYVQQANWVVVDFMWASLTGPGVKWYGNDSVRSDLLILNAVVLDTGDTYYGMDWDGNCHSLTVKYLGIIGGKGMIIRNSDGVTTFPAIGRIGQVEVDYSTGIGVEIQSGLDYDFVMPYVLGAASDGFRIAAAINAYEVRITGGKSIGNGGYGINNLGGVLLYSGNTSLYSNGLGEINGSVWNKTPRQAIDDDFYLTTSSNNPQIVFAPTDFISYDRTGNQLNFQIGGTGTIGFSASATQSFVPVYATGLRLLGSTSGYTGFVPDSAGPAVTYKLPTTVGTSNQVLSTDGSNNLFWASTGGVVTSVTATSPVNSSGGTTPNITVNATSANTPLYLVQRNASGDFSGNFITATGFYADATYYMQMSSGNPFLVFDTNDYLSYDRTNNQYNFQIAGNGVFSLSSTATQTYAPLRLMGSSSGYVGFTVPATAGGTTYTLPNADGSKNQFLKTNGSSTLSWAYSNNIVTPEDFGATGNGTTDDSAAFQAAINSGFDVYLLPGSKYAIGTTLVMSKANQSIGGPGVIKIVGAIDGIKLTSLTSTIITGIQLDLTFDSPTQTAGWAVYIDNSSRVKINKLNILYGFGGLYVQEANTVVVDFMWANLTGPGIKWYGNDTTRSDILILNSVVVDPGNTYYGMEWDGNCHTLTVKYLGIVGGKGMIIRNTAGVTTFPAIGRIGQVEVDYSTGIGVEIQAGLDYDFVMPYVLGSASDGFKIASTINAYEVRITGGKSIGNGGYGINNLGGAILYSGNTSLYSNASGETNGFVWNQSPRQAVDNDFYLTTVSNSPQIVFDNTDFLSYDRTNNELNFQIASNGIFKATPTYVQSLKPFVLPQYTVATLPAGPIGATAYVTDALAPTYNTTVVGGGSSVVRVFFDGSNWKT